MSKNIMTVECNGDRYRIVPVEGSDKWFTIVKNSRQVKRIALDELFVDGELIDIENWFGIA